MAKFIHEDSVCAHFQEKAAEEQSTTSKNKLEKDLPGEYVQYVCIYIPHISLTVSWRFTILLLGEIERQLVKAPLAAAITSHF